MASVAKPKFVSSGDSAVDKAIQVVHGGLSDLSVFDGARLLPDIQLTAGTTTRVPHGLRRKLRGWLIVRNNSGSTLGYVHDEQSSNSDTQKYLYLRCEGYSPVVSVLVF